MLLNGGELDGTRLLDPASIRLMTVNHVGEWYANAVQFPGMGFGFGFEVKIDPARRGWDIPQLASPGAFAWGGAAYTTFWVDPEQELFAIFMAQLNDYSKDELSRQFGRAVYEAILEPARQDGSPVNR